MNRRSFISTLAIGVTSGSKIAINHNPTNGVHAEDVVYTTVASSPSKHISVTSDTEHNSYTDQAKPVTINLTITNESNTDLIIGQKSYNSIPTQRSLFEYSESSLHILVPYPFAQSALSATFDASDRRWTADSEFHVNQTGSWNDLSYTSIQSHEYVKQSVSLIVDPRFYGQAPPHLEYHVPILVLDSLTDMSSRGQPERYSYLNLTLELVDDSHT